MRSIGCEKKIWRKRAYEGSRQPNSMRIARIATTDSHVLLLGKDLWRAENRGIDRS